MQPIGSHIGYSLTSPVTATNGSRKRRPLEESPRLDTTKRRMVSRACDACKLRKAKCSGTLPCSSCTKREEQCRYDTKYARGRPPTPSPPPSLDGNDNRATHSVQTSQNFPGGRPLDNGCQPAMTQDHVHDAVVEIQTQLQPQAVLSQRASPTLRGADIQGLYVEPTSGMAFLDRAWRRFSKQRPKCHEDVRLHTGQEPLATDC